MTATLPETVATITVRTPPVVGLDLSITASGIASSLGWVERIGRNEVTKLPLIDRLAAVDELVAQILDRIGTPDLVVAEVPAFSRAGGGALERAALWWKVVRALTRRGVPVAEVYNNTRMRYATGKGLASKNAVIDAVARRWPQYETGGDDNLCDAVVLMAMGAHHLGSPVGSVPATHAAALKAVAWPEVAS